MNNSYGVTPATSALLEEPAYITSDNNIISGHHVKKRIVLSILYDETPTISTPLEETGYLVTSDNNNTTDRHHVKMSKAGK